MRLGRRFSLVTSMLVAGLATLMIVPAQAADLTVSGHTNGCLGAACALGTGSGPELISNPADRSGFNFANASINATTSGGVLLLNAGPVFPNPGVQNNGNLGSFFQGTGGGIAAGTTFKLGTTFDGDTHVLTGTFSVAGTSPTTFTLDFPNTATLFTTQAGTFNLFVNDLTGLIVNGNEVALAGRIEVVSVAAATPEPGTLALLGTGVAALGAAWRRRRPRG